MMPHTTVVLPSLTRLELGAVETDPRLTLASLHASLAWIADDVDGLYKGLASGLMPSWRNFVRYGRGCNRLNKAGVRVEAAVTVALAPVCSDVDDILVIPSTAWSMRQRSRGAREDRRRFLLELGVHH